jgi:hypothetical protein
MSQICDIFLDNTGTIYIASFRTVKQPACVTIVRNNPPGSPDQRNLFHFSLFGESVGEVFGLHLK